MTDRGKTNRTERATTNRTERAKTKAIASGPRRSGSGAAKKSAPAREAPPENLKHKDDVLTVAFTADGEHIVSAGDDGYVRIWSALTGAEEHAIKFGPELQYAAVSPIGDAVAAITDKITIFSAGRGNRIAKAKGHGLYGGEVEAAFLPDGSRLVTIGRDDVMLWDTSTGKRLARHEHENGEEFFQLAVAPDGERIAVRSHRALRIHAAADLRVMSSFEEEGTGGALAWTQAGLVGSHDDGIALYDLGDRKKKRVFLKHPNSAFVADPAGNTLLSVDHSRLDRFSLDGRKIETVIKQIERMTHEIVVSPDGGRIALSVGPQIRVWDIRAGAFCLPPG